MDSPFQNNFTGTVDEAAFDFYFFDSLYLENPTRFLPEFECERVLMIRDYLSGALEIEGVRQFRNKGIYAVFALY